METINGIEVDRNFVGMDCFKDEFEYAAIIKNTECIWKGNRVTFPREGEVRFRYTEEKTPEEVIKDFEGTEGLVKVRGSWNS